MKWTPEQLADVQRQREADPDQHSFRGELTPQQREEYRQLLERELTGKDEVIRDSQPMLRAAQEPGFSGQLRRAIIGSGCGPVQLADQIGVEGRLINGFLFGEQTLPSDVITQIIDALGLETAFLPAETDS